MTKTGNKKISVQELHIKLAWNEKDSLKKKAMCDFLFKNEQNFYCLGKKKNNGAVERVKERKAWKSLEKIRRSPRIKVKDDQTKKAMMLKRALNKIRIDCVNCGQ
uniref:60S ribosomal protein L29 n=1 Tax=Rhabditophanes sp. KR3021 TaxID=114890 RepID=A0AC35TZU7_9BILA